MPKTYRGLYPQLCEFENLYLAYRAARKGKRAAATVAAFEFNANIHFVLTT
ncbi:MAG: hypothetical protein R3C14_52200 [Caldilineaceae bacterium]